jgi:phosphatidylserine decarboxylase
MPPITYIDRTTGREAIEKVYGGNALAFLYGEDVLSRLFGAPLMHALSRYPIFSAFYGWWQARGWTRNKIAPFIDRYGVEEAEFLKGSSEYSSFNDFFTRKLKPEARPIDPRPNVAVIPADARYWFYQDISQAEGFVVKGEKFCLRTLLQDPDLAERYACGSMAIARLCPSDYHRYHFPCEGIAGPTDLINGYLYSVNPIAIRKDLTIFTQNKRTLCRLDSPLFGQVLYIEIGATFVGSIHQTYMPGLQPKGGEKGYFSFGASSLILLFEPGRIAFDRDLLGASSKGQEIRCLMGQSMGLAEG